MTLHLSIGFFFVFVLMGWPGLFGDYALEQVHVNRTIALSTTRHRSDGLRNVPLQRVTVWFAYRSWSRELSTKLRAAASLPQDVNHSEPFLGTPLQPALVTITTNIIAFINNFHIIRVIFKIFLMRLGNIMW